MNGILLALQFFTSIPIRKELPMERKDVTAMYSALPFVGGMIGIAMFAIASLFLEGIGTGPLLASVFIVLTGAVLTGGLHMDGFADAGDAFFSYHDREKRLEILGDPRIGAFGTMAIVLLIVVKIALFHEVLLRGSGVWPLFVGIPLLARTGMNLYFANTRLAKEKGIAHFFKEKLSTGKVAGWSVVFSVLALIGIGLVRHSALLPVILLIVLVCTVVIFKNWSLKNFGGVSGDLCGAFIEGTEALLWLAVIICI